MCMWIPARSNDVIWRGHWQFCRMIVLRHAQPRRGSAQCEVWRSAVVASVDCCCIIHQPLTRSFVCLPSFSKWDHSILRPFLLIAIIVTLPEEDANRSGPITGNQWQTSATVDTCPYPFSCSHSIHSLHRIHCVCWQGDTLDCSSYRALRLSLPTTTVCISSDSLSLIVWWVTGLALVPTPFHRTKEISNPTLWAISMHEL